MGKYSAGYDPNAMMTPTEDTYTPELDQNYLNLTKILGIAPQNVTSKYNTYSVNAPLAQSTAGAAAEKYRKAMTQQRFDDGTPGKFYQGQISIEPPQAAPAPVTNFQPVFGGNPDDLLNQFGRV
jgi:hypothetical protein